MRYVTKKELKDVRGGLPKLQIWVYANHPDGTYGMSGEELMWPRLTLEQLSKYEERL